MAFQGELPVQMESPFGRLNCSRFWCVKPIDYATGSANPPVRIDTLRTLANRNILARHLPRGRVVAEIGVQRGRFAKVLLRKSRPAELHLIDCWEHQDDQRYNADVANASDVQHSQNLQRTRQRLRRGIQQKRVFIHQGYSVPTLLQFPDHLFDWVYVDANHTYDAVRGDLESCLPKVKPGGIIAGHDFIDTAYWKRLNYGVVEAVNEFCKEHRWEIICLTRELGNEVDRRGNPSYVLREVGRGDDLDSGRSWWPVTARRSAA